jgi:general stress protein 26
LVLIQIASGNPGAVQNLRAESRAIGTFASRDHDLFASVHGRLSLDNDPEVIDDLWNGFVGAWYEGGRDDPEVALLRFDADRAEIWENEGGLFAGVSYAFGMPGDDDSWSY